MPRIFMLSSGFEHVFLVENVHCRLMALSEIEVKVSYHSPAFGGLVDVQTAPDFDYPAGAQPGKDKKELLRRFYPFQSVCYCVYFTPCRPVSPFRRKNNMDECNHLPPCRTSKPDLQGYGVTGCE